MVNIFEDMGRTLLKTIEVLDEIRRRIKSGNACHYAGRKLLPTRVLRLLWGVMFQVEV
jgi:hypothetical protein